MGCRENSPTISAVIPAYNAVSFIQGTVKSLLNQTLPLLEIIIIDDCSSDETYRVCVELAGLSTGRIRVRRLAKNHGPSAARNIGMELAEGDWILFFDHDDIAEPRLVELEWRRLMDLQSEVPGNWVLVHSAYRQMDENGEPIGGVHRWQQVGPHELLGYLLVRNPIITVSGVLVNKKAALEAGGFDPGLRYSQDWDLWLRLAQRGGFGYVDAPLVWVRRHNRNLSRSMCNFHGDENSILRRYSISFIEEAIHRRCLPWEVNRTEFVSVLYRLGRWEEGFRALEEVVANRQDLPAGFFLLGLYYLKQKELNKAQVSFMRTLELAPDHGAALNNLAAILALSGRCQEAIELLTQAVSKFPGYLDATHNLNRLKEKERLTMADVRFTWRELRPVLTRYQE